MAGIRRTAAMPTSAISRRRAWSGPWPPLSAQNSQSTHCGRAACEMRWPDSCRNARAATDEQVVAPADAPVHALLGAGAFALSDDVGAAELAAVIGVDDGRRAVPRRRPHAAPRLISLPPSLGWSNQPARASDRASAAAMNPRLDQAGDVGRKVTLCSATDRVTTARC